MLISIILYRFSAVYLSFTCNVICVNPFQATIKCLEAPPERFRRSYRTYNIQAVSFTPAELVEEMKKHIDDFAVDYRPDERQEIGGCGLLMSGCGLLKVGVAW